jgi:glycosyltransferase involved in cell wall biosynthesis
LEITGGGPDERALRRQSQQRGLSEHVTFHGPVAHTRVPEMLRRLDIFAALSREESFGVAAIEAASCEKPVVVSDAEGFTEVTLNEKTGLIVPRNDACAAADALVRLVRDEALRASLGREGRLHVLRQYSWAVSLNHMIDTYHTVITGATSRSPYPA